MLSNIRRVLQNWSTGTGFGSFGVDPDIWYCQEHVTARPRRGDRDESVDVSILPLLGVDVVKEEDSHGTAHTVGHQRDLPPAVGCVHLLDE